MIHESNPTFYVWKLTDNTHHFWITLRKQTFGSVTIHTILLINTYATATKVCLTEIPNLLPVNHWSFEAD